MKRAIVTGACGFIGTCLTRRLIERDVQVIGIDNLSRPGTENNYLELSALGGFRLIRVDLANFEKCEEVFRSIGEVDAIFHLAAQVAVTTSYGNRRADFLDNATASFNVLEAARMYSPNAYCLYASTNKVYGHIEVAKPVGCSQPLDPYTPYGVSKATGELYFTEYGRKETGMDTISLRQSCIYGHHQYGVEDQGWMAWFSIANLLKKPITIYGDGEQVRDLLFVDDLIDLYLAAYESRLTGAFPVGGGAENQISLSQGLDLISEIAGDEFQTVDRGEVRPGDQPYFVADMSWLGAEGLDWRPKVGVRDGVEEMIGWIKDHLPQIQRMIAQRG